MHSGQTYDTIESVTTCLFLAAACILWLCPMYLKRQYGGDGAIHALELAYLVGGSATAVYAAILSLVQGGAIQFRCIGFFNVTGYVNDSELHPLELVIHKSIVGSPKDSPLFAYGHDEIEKAVTLIKSSLQAKGLIFEPVDFIAYRVLPSVLLFVASAVTAMQSAAQPLERIWIVIGAALMSAGFSSLLWVGLSNGRTPEGSRVIRSAFRKWHCLIGQYSTDKSKLSPDEVMLVAALLGKSYPELPGSPFGSRI